MVGSPPCLWKRNDGECSKGRSGPSPHYSCPECNAKIMGITVSKSRMSFMRNSWICLIKYPTEETKKLFKQIVLREWNNEIKDSQLLARSLDSEIQAVEDKKSRVMDLFIEEKISERDKDVKFAELEVKRTNLLLRRSEIGNEIHDRETIIDGALLFMSAPGKFWNLVSIDLKKRVQDLIFPEGMVYDCDQGFRTAKLADSYLLINKIAREGDLNSTLVAATGFEPVTLGL